MKMCSEFTWLLGSSHRQKASVLSEVVRDFSQSFQIPNITNYLHIYHN
jgi:hypothetical protein